MSRFVPGNFHKLTNFVRRHGSEKARELLASGKRQAAWAEPSGQLPLKLIEPTEWSAEKAERWLRTGLYNEHPHLHDGAFDNLGFEIFVATSSAATEPRISNGSGRKMKHEWPELAGYIVAYFHGKPLPKGKKQLEKICNEWFDDKSQRKERPHEREVQRFASAVFKSVDEKPR